MPGRTIAIGDIHGFTDSLRALLAAIDPQPDDTILPLGDFVDRGPDSPGTLETLIALGSRCQLIPILGNHDEMLLAIRDGAEGMEDWLRYGGRQTLQAYGCSHPSKIPQRHADFLEACHLYHETDTHFFVHASFQPELPLQWQMGSVLRWVSIRDNPPGPHFSGKIAIVGHTAQKNGEILDLGYLKCIDTCCYCGQWLTALEVNSGQVWQADPAGVLRTKDRG